MSTRRTRKNDGSQWTVADSRSVYGIRHWGAGYFAISDAGHVEVRPNRAARSAIDLHQLVAELRQTDLSLPLLVRFPDILQDRVRQLTGAFDASIERLGYQSRYTALYPIKVNQQEAVVENIIATLAIVLLFSSRLQLDSYPAAQESLYLGQSLLLCLLALAICAVALLVDSEPVCSARPTFNGLQPFRRGRTSVRRLMRRP